jgi:AcrR family transcriptional regulator
MTPTQVAGPPASGVRRGGRPRSAEADVAILDAATEEFIEHGLDGMSVDEVASRAGVSKATIYRRYPSTLALVVAAARQCRMQDVVVGETGVLEHDLRALARATVQMLRSSQAGRAIPRMIADSARQQQLAHERRALVVDRRAQPVALVEHAIARGELQAGTDPAVVVDMLAAPLFYRSLLSGEPSDDAYIDELVAAVLRAFRRG